MEEAEEAEADLAREACRWQRTMKPNGLLLGSDRRELLL
jgi:hypothetical protein